MRLFTPIAPTRPGLTSLLGVCSLAWLLVTAPATTQPSAVPAPLEPAAPLTEAELSPLFAALPDGLSAVGVVHVGQLLSPAALDLLLEGIRRLQPGLTVEGLDQVYDDSVRPLAAAIRSCLFWAADDVGAVCAGSFGAPELELLDLAFSACPETGSSCGDTTALLPGHRVRWTAEDHAALLVDEGYLVLGASLAEAQARAAALVAALDSGETVPAPVLGGAPLDTRPTVSALATVPRETQESLGLVLGQPVAIGAVRVALQVAPAAEALFELRAMVGDPTSASDLRQAVAGMALLSIAADPAASQLLGPDPAAALDEMLTAQGDEVVLRFEGQTLTGVLAAVAVPAFVGYVRAAREGTGEGTGAVEAP